MRVSLFKDSSESFLAALDEAEIPYIVQAPTFGRVQASGISVGIADVAAVSAPLAAVIVAWLRSRASRKVIVTMQDNKVVHIEGYTTEQVKALLPLAKDLSAADTAPEET